MAISDDRELREAQTENNEGGQQAPGGAAPAKEIPQDAVIILPVRNVVLFPGVVLPLSLGRGRSIAAAQEAARSNRPIGVILQRDPQVENPAGDDLYPVGTVASIVRYVTAPDRSHHVICQGENRFRVIEFLEGYPFLVARIERIGEKEVMTTELEARMHTLKQRAVEALQLFPEVPAELVNAVDGLRSPSALADVIASFMDIKPEEKQQVLETTEVQERLDRVLDLLNRRIEVMRLSQEISQRTKQAMDERQREYLLREQLKAIQKELGEEDGRDLEIEELKKAIAEAKMPPDVEQVAVIGVPHERWGEAIHAVVRRRAGSTLTEEELISFAAQRLSSYKKPRSVEFVDALPISATGKILKKELRKRYPGSTQQVAG